MITLDPQRSNASPAEYRIQIIGLGGAGSNLLNQIISDGLGGSTAVAMNTDSEALNKSLAPQKIQLGIETTRGLGTGGDPEMGCAATEEAMESIRQVLQGADIVFICVGLGGGTGSGGARLLAGLARDQGARVVIFATLPFTFEGQRRVAQAEDALAAIREDADILICFENDRMSSTVGLLDGMREAFAASDQILSEAVRSVTALARRRGLVQLGFDELSSALRGAGEPGARCLFGYGESTGPNRASDALTKALKNPLLDYGHLLQGAPNILVSIAGGTNVTLHEVEDLMTALNRSISPQAQIFFGAAVDPQMGETLSVTILSALGTQPILSRSVSPRAVIPPAKSLPIAPSEALGETDQEVVEETAKSTKPPELIPQENSRGGGTKSQTKKTAPKQEQMMLDPVGGGRFQHSEPTIVNGQNLDVPTYIRLNIKLK
ncbi:MAG: cell division protein FtsZ [Verrucomicrobiota bacterium]